MAATAATDLRKAPELAAPAAKAARKVTALAAALGDARSLVLVLSFLDDVRDVEACACTSLRCFAANDGVRRREILGEMWWWKCQFEDLERELAGVRDEELAENWRGGPNFWDEGYREQFLRLYTLGLLTNTRTFLAPPPGVDDDAVGLEAEAARLRADNADDIDGERADHWHDAVGAVELTHLEIAKLACRARRWRDPFGVGHDAFEKLPPGWTLPPPSALRHRRASPFEAPGRQCGLGHFGCDIIYQYQGAVKEASPDQHRDLALREAMNFHPSRVPSVGASLRNLGGAEDADLAARIQDERQRHASDFAARKTDALRASQAAARARRALEPPSGPWGFLDDLDLLSEEYPPYYSTTHSNLYDFRGLVLAEAEDALARGFLPKHLVEAVRTRFIPIAKYATNFAQFGDMGDGDEWTETVVFTFAPKTVAGWPEVSFEDVYDGMEFVIRRNAGARDGIGWAFGRIMARSVNSSISGQINHRDAHHVWQWNDSCTGEGQSSSSDYAEYAAFQAMDLCIVGANDGPFVEPNQMLRLLLLCGGYKFSTAPPGDNKHPCDSIIPRTSQASNSDCETGWTLLQKKWEEAHGVEEADSKAQELVFATDDRHWD
mmetsp:Transcript_10306/g.30804  ORF Transcript_10306/g.30804 Transcript_10306/m.30804 type:complete len:608 (+) Transcript_10306:77-1900(+)